MLKPRLYRLAGIFVSVFFVYLAVRNANLAESLQVLKTVQPVFLGAAVITYLAAYPVRALRWRLILQTHKTLSFGKILGPIFVGYMANALLPARAGEIYRAHLLGRRARISRSLVLGSIVVERTFDGLMLVGLMLLLLVLLPETHFLGPVTLTTGLVFLTLAAGILFYSFTVNRTHRMIDKILEIFPLKFEEFIARKLKSFLQGLQGVSAVGVGLKAIVYTILIWALEISAVALVVISFGVYLPLSGYLLVYALAALSTALPSGPAYIGPFQYAFVLSLGFFAISQETALAISVITQLVLLTPVTLIGLALLWREQLGTMLLLNQEKVEPKKGKVRHGGRAA